MLPKRAEAVPVFSRKYRTSCSTCHYAFPQLNAFGKAFQSNGFRYPGGDADLRKDDPVSLGSEAYKQVWPNAIWPSDIPGGAPIAVHAVGSIEAPFNQPDSVAKTNFLFPQHVQLFYAGTLGEKFSFFGEVEVENEGGEVNLGFPFRLALNQAPSLNVTVGSLHFDPTPGDFGLTPTAYNVSGLASRNGWTAEGEQPGIQLWGAGNGSGGRGGWKYVGGIVEGQGLSDAGRDKDYFARASYKIGGLGETGGTEGQASSSSAFYRDNNATLGGYVYSGRVAGATFAEREDLTALAGTADIWYGRAILNATVFHMTSKIASTPDRKSLAWYVQGQYVIYPWLIGITRYESTNEDTEDAVKAATTLVPAVVGMVRANIKVSLEYRRPLSDYSARKVEEEGLVTRLNFAL
jgi:hypothetical protein